VLRSAAAAGDGKKTVEMRVAPFSAFFGDKVLA
jgi:hypothetical protein